MATGFYRIGAAAVTNLQLNLGHPRRNDHVYMLDSSSFRNLFHGSELETFPRVRWITPELISSVEESAARLAPKFANEIYRSVDHWGSRHFTLKFSWWLRRDYLVDSLVDFLVYPLWYGPSDVTEVILYRRMGRFRRLLRHILYSHKGWPGKIVEPTWCVFASADIAPAGRTPTEPRQ